MFDKGSPIFDWVILDDLIISRGFPGSIPDSVWNAFLSDMEKGAVKYIIALTFGTASLTATQRRAAADTMRKLDIAAVVVADSALTRGIVTAVSWLGAKTKSFSWNDVEGSVKHFELPTPIQSRAREIILEFKGHATKMGKLD